MGEWDTDDTGNVAAHEFGHMLGHPDEYADAACPARNPVSTGTVMDNNTAPVARHLNRIAAFHGAGHAPVAAPGEPAEHAQETKMNVKMIDKLASGPRAAILERLRGMADAGAAPEGAEDAEVVFEVSGGAPGEHYSYRLGVRGDGAAEREVVDELQPGGRADVQRGTDRELASRVFQAAADSGLLDDAAPDVPREHAGDLLPDSMIAIITVRDGNSVRRVVVPAGEPSAGAAGLPGESADVPLETPMQLPAGSVAALLPVLDARRAVEAAL
jgi:hypothetical protein